MVRLQRPCTLSCCLRRSSYLPSADVTTSHALCPLQRAMNMTEDQKRTLRAEFGRTLAGSAQLLAQREALWRQALGVKIMGTDGRLTERMSAVRTPTKQSPDRMQRIPQSDLRHALCIEGARSQCYYVSCADSSCTVAIRSARHLRKTAQHVIVSAIAVPEQAA